VRVRIGWDGGNRIGEVLRRHVVALLCVVALIGTAVGIAITSPPASEMPDDFHGRTWLSVASSSGPQLVLVNGISGLIEGRSLGAPPPTGSVRFVDSIPAATMMGSGSAVTVVDNGTHQAVTRPGLDAAKSVLADGYVFTTDPVPEILDPDLQGEPRKISGAPDPVSGAAPVVDGAGDAWYLASDGTDRTAQRVDDAGSTVSAFDVDDSTALLVVVDGAVFAAGPREIVEVDGDGARTVAARTDVLPTVANATEGVWAAADGRTVTVFRDNADEGSSVQVESAATSLAIWQGAVVVTTDLGASIIRGGEASSIEPIGGNDGPASVHSDGGMLWVVGDEAVVAIDRDLNPTTFELAAIDVNVCVGTCSSEDLAKLLEQQSTTTTTIPRSEANRTTTTTEAPRDLTPPPVDPTVPTTTSTTTIVPGPDDSREQPQSTTTAAPSPSIPAVTAPVTVPVTEPGTIPVDSSIPTPTAPPIDTPTTRPPVTQPSTPPTFPPITLPPDTEPPTTTQPPPQEVPNGLQLSVTPGLGFATAHFGVTGTPGACSTLGPGLRAGGTLSGSFGTIPVTVRWDDPQSTQSDLPNQTIPNLSGRVDITFSACGLATTQTVDVPSPLPSVGDIVVQPDQPIEGDRLDASVAISTPPGWSVTSADWSGGTCPVEGQPNFDTTGSSARFTATGTVCQISVVVVFRDDTGQPQNFPRNNNVAVLPSTTTTEPTTTTESTTTTSSTTPPPTGP